MTMRDRGTRNLADRGFTLIEVLIAVAILAALVAATIPAFTPNDRQRMNASAMMVLSDIEFAQVMTIARPDQPLVVGFDANRVRYWIARADSPYTPINRPGTNEPYVVVLGQGRAETAAGITISPTDLPDRLLEFDTHGGLADFTRSPIISLMAAGTNYPRVQIAIAPTTGTASVTYQRAPSGY